MVGSHQKADSILAEPAWNERAYDRERKKKQRASGKELFIPEPKNYALRLRCLSNFELLLQTYFPSEFDESFTDDRRAMLNSIVHAARYGGDQSIAGSRGEGKTTLAINGAGCLMLACLSMFPVVIGKNQDSSSDELKAFREKLQQSERFIEDFPEIGIPLEAIGGWSSNARLQTVQGKPVGAVLGVKYFAFPNISKEQLPHWNPAYFPVSRGQVMGALGIDGKIRGAKFRSQRPTLAIIDDIEDREAANSDAIIEKNEEIIEKDVAGLGRGSERVARVMLCTIQNRKCIAYKYTDPKQKQSWKGKRYRKMLTPPTRMDLVEQYITMRKEKTADDPDAREAYRFWIANQGEIERDCIVSNKQSHSKKIHEDGEPLESSAIQAYYNRVADWGPKSVATEIDNDPPPESGPMGIGITADIVVNRISGLARRQLPINTVALTAAIDLGKYRCHWVVCAWWQGAGGVVVDYGVAEVHGNERVDTMEASEPAIYRTLLNWREELLQKKFVDGTGTERKVDFCLVDSGAFTNAAYEFCRQVNGIFHPSKGQNPYRQKRASTETIIAGANLHASRLSAQNIWLYELDTNYWKQWIHERFLTPTFDEQNMLRRGSLSLYATEGSKTHSSFAQHIVAEELVSEFKDGKGTKTHWDVKNDNNHWFDALCYAASGSEACGVKPMAVSDDTIEPRHVNADKPKQSKPKQQHGRFKTRLGGWIPRRK